MATTVARLEAVLSASTRDFDRAMSKSEGKMKGVGRTAGIAGGLIAGGLAVGLASSVKEAIQAEKTQKRLETAYSKSVKFGIEPYRNEIVAASKAAVNLGFDDEDLKDSLGRLIVATHSHKKAQELANIAMDVARFKDVSLEAATKTLTMAMAGSQRAAKQLGLTVQAVTTEQDKAKKAFDANKDAINAHYDALGKLTPAEEKAKQAALDHAKAQYDGAKATGQVMDKQVTAEKVITATKNAVKGQAKAYSETAAGEMEVFQQKTDNLKEHLGTVLLPALGAVVDKLIKMADWLEKNPKVMKGLIISLGILTGALLAAAAAQAALNLAVLANPYVAAVVGVAAFYGAVFILYKKFKELRPEIEFFLETVAGLPLPLRLALIALGGVHGAVDKLRGPVMKLADAFHTVQNFLSPVVDLMKWIINNAKKIGGVLGAVGGALGKVNPFGDADANKFKSILMAGGTGPKSISPRLYDELSGAKSMGLMLTSGYRPGATTKHGTKSDHSYYPSKAIDVAGSPNNMARFFRWLIGQTDVKQAFYDPLGSIFGGVLNSYREGGHSDHVHVATYDKGGWLRPGWNLAYNGLGQPERVGGGGNLIVNLPNYVGSKAEIVSVLQNWARQHRRRNGRGPF